MQSGFVTVDSTINQLTYLYHTFCEALDSGKEVRVVFCDVSKAFDRVWHTGLVAKLEAVGVHGPLSPPYTHNNIVNNIESIKLKVTFLATNCTKY